MPAEIILIGGASVLINYGFRAMTNDMDAIITANSAIKDAIAHVADQYGLPLGWLNDDFTKTKSYSPKLVEHSTYYKTFSGIQIRTVSAEYLVAMKLMSGRKYKNDLSDIVRVVAAHAIEGRPLSYAQVDKAVCDLYGDWKDIPDESKQFLASVLGSSDPDALYRECRDSENEAEAILVAFEGKYPGALKEDNISSVLRKAKELEGQK